MAQAPQARSWAARSAALALPRLTARLAQTFRVTATELARGTPRRPVAQARAAVGAVAATGLGLLAQRVGAALGVAGWSILRGLPRGRAALQRHGLDPARLAPRFLRQGA